MAAHCIYNFILIFLLNTENPPDFLFTEQGDFSMPVVGVSLVLFILIVVFIYKSRKIKTDEEMVHSDEIEAEESVP